MPGAEPDSFCRKLTIFLGNFQEILALERACPGLSASHRHEHAFGSRVVDGKCVKLAAAAGHYPFDLVKALAGIIKSKVGDPWLGSV